MSLMRAERDTNVSAEERQIFTSSAPANVQFSTGSQAGGPPSYDQLMWYNQYKTLSATGSDDVTIDLQSFVNPVFELLFAARLKANLDANDWTNFSRCGPSQSGATGFAGTHEHKPPLAGNTAWRAVCLRALAGSSAMRR